jgi:uroporphyrinogen-III synthase
LHSGESLKNWYDLLIEAENTEALNQPILVPGDRVAEQAQLLGFTKITMAQNAADDTMLNALINAVSK